MANYAANKASSGRNQRGINFKDRARKVTRLRQVLNATEFKLSCMNRAPQKAKVFLSYAREDKEKVEAIYEKLSRVGFSPWMDIKDILPGERWEASIESAIENSHFFLACLSKNSVDKRGLIQKETRKAIDVLSKLLDNDIYFVPIRLEECNIPEKISKFQYIDLFDNTAETWQKLIKALNAGLEKRGILTGNVLLSMEFPKDRFESSVALQNIAIEEVIMGITHDIKNFSALIAGEIEWLKKRKDQDALEKEDIGLSISNVESYIRKMEQFTDFLRARIHKLAPKLESVSLDAIIDNAINLLMERATRTGVRILKDRNGFDLDLIADPRRLSIAFYSIIENSIDSMPTGGTIEVESLRKKDEIEIQFKDTGLGIPPELLSNIFQPLFTTKDKGFGLGLSLTKRIIERDHNGKVTVMSLPDKGTTVIILIPKNARIKD